jgi:hypothetical protein
LVTRAILALASLFFNLWAVTSALANFCFRSQATSSGVTFYFDVEIIRVYALCFETGAAVFRPVSFASHSPPARAATTSIGGNQ